MVSSYRFKKQIICDNTVGNTEICVDNIVALQESATSIAVKKEVDKINTCYWKKAKNSLIYDN